MPTYILSHTDADGVLSSRIIERATIKSGDTCTTEYQHWNYFGVGDWNLDALRKYDRIFVLDLGTSKKDFERLKPVSEWAQVYVMDHHPPDCDPSKYTTPKLVILNNEQNCTTGLAYQFASAQNQVDKIDLAYACMGVYSDVVTETTGGSQILQSGRVTWDSLFWSNMYWTGEYEAKVPRVSLVGALINAARRVAYDSGPAVARKALIECETYGSFDLLIPLDRQPISKDLEASYPYSTVLRTWYREWNEKKTECLEQNRCTTYDLGAIHVAITNHPYNCVGYVAGVKSRNVPCIAINYGVPDPTYANMSGRVNKGSTMNLDVVMKAVTEISGGTIAGGGHPEAVGGTVSRALTIEQVLHYFSVACEVGV